MSEPLKGQMTVDEVIEDVEREALDHVKAAVVKDGRHRVASCPGSTRQMCPYYEVLRNMVGRDVAVRGSMVPRESLWTPGLKGHETDPPAATSRPKKRESTKGAEGP